MSVSIGRTRFALGIAAFIALSLVGGSSVALAFHGSPSTPSYVTEYSVPGSEASFVADGGPDATWVSGAGANGKQLVKVAANGALTPYAVGSLPPERIAVTPGFVWATATDRVGLPQTPSPKIIKLDLATSLATTYNLMDGQNIGDIAALPGGSVWFVEVTNTTGTIGKIDTAGVITRYPIAGSQPFALAAAYDGSLWFLEHVVTQTGNETRVAKLTITNNVASASPEYSLGSNAATQLISGPDDALWFIEFGGTEFSITKLPITGPATGAPERHGLGNVFSFALASADNALWFTTGGAGNVGRMTPGGAVSLFCDGPSHPSWIAAGPGANAVTFGEFDARVGRLDIAKAMATGIPCPVPLPPPGGAGGTKRVVKDTTPAKISLSGRRTQRFTRKGTIVVTVKCNEACRAAGRASVSVSGASKVFRSGIATRQLAAGKAAKLTLKFPKKAVRAITRSLRKKKRGLKATIAIMTRDAAGNASRARRSVKLKR